MITANITIYIFNSLLNERRYNCINIDNSISNLINSFLMVEPLLSGIVLGLIAVTIFGLFSAAYLQYRRGNQIGL